MTLVYQYLAVATELRTTASSDVKFPHHIALVDADSFAPFALIPFPDSTFR